MTSQQDIARGRALERADIMVWLITMSEIISRSESAHRELIDANVDPSGVIRFFETTAESIYEGTHEGACDTIGDDLAFLHPGGAATASTLADLLLKEMSKA